MTIMGRLSLKVSLHACRHRRFCELQHCLPDRFRAPAQKETAGGGWEPDTTSPVVPVFVHIVANQGQLEFMKVLVLIVWE